MTGLAISESREDDVTGQIVEEVLPEADEVLTPYLVKVSLLAGCSGLLFGWDTGIAAGMLVAIKGDLGHPLTAGEQEMIVSATTLGALIGSLIAGKAADWLGRKKVIVIAALLFLLGSLEQTASQDVSQLVLGRLIVGVAVGQAAAVVPTYLAEVAPTNLRGRIVGMNSLLITGGQVVAYIVNAALFPLKHSWRWMALASALPALVQLLGLLYLDESPRWLINKGHYVQARRVMGKVYPMASSQQIETMVDRILESLKVNQGDASSHLADSSPGQRLAHGDTEEHRVRSAPRDERSKWALLFFEPQNRRALILAAGLQAFQQAVGFNALMYYSSRLLLIAGFKSNPNSFAILIALANFAGTLVAMRYVDSWGRRKLLLWTTLFMGVSLAFVAIFFELIGDAAGGVVDDPVPSAVAAAKPTASSVFDSFVAPSEVHGGNLSSTAHEVTHAVTRSVGVSEWPLIVRTAQSTGPNLFAVLSLIFMVLFTLSYASGPGTVPWLVLSEIFSGQVRSLGSSLASCANWTMNLLWSATYLSLVETVGGPGRTFAIFAAISAGSWIFTYTMLPELKGVSINEVGKTLGQDTTRLGPAHDWRAEAGEGDDEREGLLDSSKPTTRTDTDAP
ncbi:unnamed protein product [Parajaminaea phylloscopi]